MFYDSKITIGYLQFKLLFVPKKTGLNVDIEDFWHLIKKPQIWVKHIKRLKILTTHHTNFELWKSIYWLGHIKLDAKIFITFTPPIFRTKSPFTKTKTSMSLKFVVRKLEGHSLQEEDQSSSKEPVEDRSLHQGAEDQNTSSSGLQEKSVEKVFFRRLLSLTCVNH